ncbi:25S rRNA (uridine-N(3))-methyltransferase [Schizosaccharomyces pombe]
MGKKARFKEARRLQKRNLNNAIYSSSINSQNSLTNDKIGKGKNKGPTERYVLPFEKNNKFLLLGEGNFSFAFSLLLHHVSSEGFVLATSYDSKEDLKQKYPDAAEYISKIEINGGKVMHEIDATKLHLHKKLKTQKFDTIFWNFPHSGKGIKDQDRNILDNQKMLLAFFKASKFLLSEKGVIVITLAETKPYTLWNLKGLAKDAGYTSLMTEKFDSSFYPEYSHRRTIGWIDGISERSPWKGELRDSRHYCFVVNGSNIKPYNQRKEKRKRSELSDDSSDSS